VDAIARFDYPRELLDIQVLDDSTDETQEVARGCVERYQALGLPIHYLHRNDRSGFKAGALAAGLESATGEFVAILTPISSRRPIFCGARCRISSIPGSRWSRRAGRT